MQFGVLVGNGLLGEFVRGDLPSDFFHHAVEGAKIGGRVRIRRRRLVGRKLAEQ